LRYLACRPQPTEWQRIANKIDAAFVAAWSDFVGVDRRLHQRWTFNHFVIAVWRTKEAECSTQMPTIFENTAACSL
jgi:hypothetical protein